MIVERPKRSLKNSRVLIGSAKRLEVEDMPNLIENQLSSYEWFLQRKAKQNGEELKNQGLEALFREIFPIKSMSNDILFILFNNLLSIMCLV